VRRERLEVYEPENALSALLWGLEFVSGHAFTRAVACFMSEFGD